MDRCVLCGRESPESISRSIFTGRQVSFDVQDLGYAIRHTRTYSDFREHLLDVCGRCRTFATLWKALGFAGLLIFLSAFPVMAIFPPPSDAQQSWPGAPLLFGCVILPFPLWGICYLRNQTRRLKRKAKEERALASGDPAYKFTAFTEKQRRKLIDPDATDQFRKRLGYWQ
jgi:hypothetical protein